MQSDLTRAKSVSLAERLAAQIRERGPMRFDRFQTAALYDRQDGYYEKPGRIGREGDFVTGASWHPAFARSLARIAELLRVELACETLDVVDVGAGEGQLLRFLADACRGRSVRLLGVERSASRRAIAESRVPEARFVPSIASLPGDLRGLIVAYELFDALPVRALRAAEDGTLRERVVGLSKGALAFEETSAHDAPAILAGLARRGAALEPGQLLEIRPGVGEVAREIAGKLARGLVLLFDYGAPTRALYGPARFFGTLEAFRAHEVTRDVLGEPGSRDITAWVDFGELEEALTAAQFQVRGLVSQSRLLLNAGIAGEVEEEPETPISPERSAERNAIAKLFAPGGMGESLRVLVAERGTCAGSDLVREIGSASR